MHINPFKCNIDHKKKLMSDLVHRKSTSSTQVKQKYSDITILPEPIPLEAKHLHFCGKTLFVGEDQSSYRKACVPNWCSIHCHLHRILFSSRRRMPFMMNAVKRSGGPTNKDFITNCQYQITSATWNLKMFCRLEGYGKVSTIFRRTVCVK
jgi:hypothetical protein